MPIWNLVGNECGEERRRGRRIPYPEFDARFRRTDVL